ncbi:unnamed protein product [Allacma fusca]|uniref:Uncharacterized protein n=1 Tax=Allacma fusca TaxID=39272 RepID=A0A8J2KA23_9HEXA|nr:unnamed protein product [Allacma fusca]
MGELKNYGAQFYEIKNYKIRTVAVESKPVHRSCLEDPWRTAGSVSLYGSLIHDDEQTPWPGPKQYEYFVNIVLSVDLDFGGTRIIRKPSARHRCYQHNFFTKRFALLLRQCFGENIIISLEDMMLSFAVVHIKRASSKVTANLDLFTARCCS